MNILHVTQIGATKEGIGSVLSKLVPKQIQLGHKVKVISVIENKLYLDLEIDHINSPKGFHCIVNSFSPDIVIFHSVYQFCYLNFARFLTRQHIPYLIQMHGALSQQNYSKGKLKKWIANLLFFNNFFKHAAAIIYLNTAERDNCIIKNIISTSIIIPNGCDRISNIDLNHYPQSPIDIIYIGRIDMIHKGNDILIEAIELLRKEGYNKCKISVYSNPNDPDLKLFKHKIKHLTQYIEYKGGIYGSDKDKRLRNADIFILTSRYEGMPMGVLEALSYGVPCIVTPGTNMSKDIEDNRAGWVTTMKPSDIASTIRIAVENYLENYQQYRKNALNLSYAFDWDIIAFNSIIYYNSVLSNSNNSFQE